MSEDFRLDKNERDSALWQKIEGELERRLAMHREDNDSPRNDDTETAVIRGRIQELKALRAWVEDPPPHIEDATEY